jgi:hypothetical protein
MIYNSIRQISFNEDLMVVKRETTVPAPHCSFLLLTSFFCWTLGADWAFEPRTAIRAPFYFSLAICTPLKLIFNPFLAYFQKHLSD